MEIIINNNRIQTEEISLKKVLEQHGMYFPCQGKGICGRCQVSCSELTPTSLDKRFLTDTQIEEGVRLACDKSVSDNINISYIVSEYQQPNQTLEFANIAIMLDNEKMNIAILDYDIVTELVVANEMHNSSNKKIYLRSLISKECIEFFERYGIAKAQTIAIAANSNIATELIGKEIDGQGELLEASELMLPSEQVYVLPFIDDIIGGDFLSFVTMQRNECVAIKADTDFVVALVGEKEIICYSHKNVSYSKEELPALDATLQLLFQSVVRPPIIKLFGQHTQALEPLLQEYTYAIEDTKAVLETVGKTIDDNRLKSQLFKLQKKFIVLEAVENEQWQELFILSANK